MAVRMLSLDKANLIFVYCVLRYHVHRFFITHKKWKQQTAFIHGLSSLIDIFNKRYIHGLYEGDLLNEIPGL